MKKISLLTGLFTLSMNYAQIKFEKGYIINNAGEKTEVLIKDVEWKNNPQEFEYKLNDSSEAKIETVKNIAEFAIENSEKYVRKTVLIDHSSNVLNSLSYKRDPEFVEKTVFLKYIVEGKTNLFYYENDALRRFFYNIDQSDVKQLIYKSYSINESQIGYNEDYKIQLTKALQCGVTDKDIQRAEYRTTSLTKIFMKYNECSSGASVNHQETKTKRDFFNLTIRPGISSIKLQTTQNYYSIQKTDYDRKISFRIGAEFEFILPFNKNKWALFIEPTYQYYKSNADATLYPGEFYEEKVKRSVDYKTIDIPFGARHYFFLNDRSKLFVNLAYVMSVSFGSKIKQDNSSEMKTQSAGNFAFGAGYKYNDKFSVELRVNTSRNILNNYLLWDSNYNSASLIFGYTIF